MNKKIIIVVCILLIIFILTMIIALNKSKSSQCIIFNNKMAIMEEQINENSEYKKLVQNNNNPGVILSVSDETTRAIVKYAQKSNVEKSLDQAKKDIEKYLQKNDYEPNWIKVDFINNVQKVDLEEWQKTIKNLTIDNILKNGIKFKYKGHDIVLTDGEISANNILNADYSINLENLNNYLKKQNRIQVKKLPEDLYVFDAISFFCDEKNNVYDLCNVWIDTGRRNIDLNKNQVEEIINTSRAYLFNMEKEDGKFIYGYNAQSNSEIEEYNILRHSGSVWSLILTYNEEDGEIRKKKIDLGIEYLKNNLIIKEGKAYALDTTENTVKLGGNALATIAICEYIDKFGNNDEYLKIAKQLGNGIIQMQKEEGQFVHVLNPNNLEVISKYRTVYYDGEATFALAKLYGITKDKKYLEAAEKAMDYFIENNYLTYKDHWLSYAANEITKYSPKEKYFEFGLKNVGENKQQLLDTNSTSHTDFELLMQCYELYERMEKEGININYSKLTKQDLEKYIKERAYVQLNTYLYPEKAMYLSNPSKYVNTFCIIKSNYRIRIDDIQHSITGYYYYLKTQ